MSVNDLGANKKVDATPVSTSLRDAELEDLELAPSLTRGPARPNPDHGDDGDDDDDEAKSGGGGDRHATFPGAETTRDEGVNAKGVVGAQVDDAARRAERLQHDAALVADFERGRRKLDVRVVPALLLLWLCNFIDRANIGNARIAGLEKELGLKGRQFNTALAVFYVGYIVAELPSNMALRQVGGHIWLPLITAVWGALTMCIAAARNYSGLLALRFVLGLSEGGLLPGISLYLSQLYARHELQRRVGAFYAAASLAGAFGGLLATGLNEARTSLPYQWQLLFLVEGAITVAFAVVAYMLLPRSVERATFLSTAEKHAARSVVESDASTQHRTLSQLRREVALARMAVAANADHAVGRGANLYDEREKRRPSSWARSSSPSSTLDRFGGASAHDDVPAAGIADDDVDDAHFEWRELRRGVTDVQTWLTGVAYLCICVSLYSFTLFLPTILAGLYPEASQAPIQLLTVPPFVPSALLVLVVAWCSDRLRMRGPFILALLPISMVGYALLIASCDAHVNYAGVFLLTLGIYPSAPCIIALINNNSSGQVKRAASVAMQLMIANLAGFVATFLYDSQRFGGARRFVVPHAVVLACLGLGWLCVGANVAYCWWKNAERARGELTTVLTTTTTTTSVEEKVTSRRRSGDVVDAHDVEAPQGLGAVSPLPPTQTQPPSPPPRTPTSAPRLTAAQRRRVATIEAYLSSVERGETRAPMGDRDPAFRFTL